MSLDSTLPSKITKSSDYKDFSVLSVLNDFQNGQLVATVRCGGTQLPLVLWSGVDYDPSANWKSSDILTRIKEVLPAAIGTM